MSSGSYLLYTNWHLLLLAFWIHASADIFTASIDHEGQKGANELKWLQINNYGLYLLFYSIHRPIIVHKNENKRCISYTLLGSIALRNFNCIPLRPTQLSLTEVLISKFVDEVSHIVGSTARSQWGQSTYQQPCVKDSRTIAHEAAMMGEVCILEALIQARTNIK